MSSAELGAELFREANDLCNAPERRAANMMRRLKMIFHSGEIMAIAHRWCREGKVFALNGPVKIALTEIGMKPAKLELNDEDVGVK